MKKRLIQFLSYLKIGQTKFEEKVGLSRGFINNIGNSIRVDSMQKMLSIYPELNQTWLMTGEGEMLKKSNTSNAKAAEISMFTYIPMVPIPAQAGYPSGYGDPEYIDSLPTFPVIVDRNYRGSYRVFEVNGDSMYDSSASSYQEGDKLLCRDVRRELWTSKLHINDWDFVVVHKEDGILVKRIIKHDVEDGVITCHSLNPMYDDFTLQLEDVLELYNVIKMVDRVLKR